MAEHYIKEVQQNGYTTIPNAFDSGVVVDLLRRTKGAVAKKLKVLGDDYPTRNYGYYYNMQNHDVAFIRALFSQPILSEVMRGLLNDVWYKTIPQDKPNYIFRGIKARNGGSKALPLHIDSFIPSSGKYTWVALASIILEDQDESNGCTVVVPGSHVSGKYADRDAKSGAIPIISKAGDIVVWDSRLWHGTTENNSDRSRWVLISGFCRWWVKQSFQNTETLPNEIYQQLTDEEKIIMGYCSTTPVDEFDPRNKYDGKCGVDFLPKQVSINHASEKVFATEKA